MDYTRAEILGGGAGKGLHYTAYIKAKEDLHLTDSDLGDRSLKYGTSIGSMFAAGLSEGISSEDIRKIVLENKKIIDSLFRPKWIFENAGLSDFRDLEKIVREIVGSKKMKDMPDLNIMGTDRNSMESVLINYENFPDVHVYEAILASSAIAPLFPPRTIGKDENKIRVVDGGYSNGLPLDIVVKNESIKEIICTDLMAVSKSRPIPETRNIFDNYSLLTIHSGTEKIRQIFAILGMDYEKAINDVVLQIPGTEKLLCYVTPNINFRHLFKMSIKDFEELSKDGSDFTEALQKFEKFKKRKGKIAS